MAHIVAYGGTKRLQLGNEEMLRPLPFGNNWKAVRLGAMFSINTQCALDNTSSYPLNTRVAMGFCTGLTGGFQSPTSDWIGVCNVLNATDLGSFAYSSFTKAPPSLLTGNGVGWVRKEGATQPRLLVGSNQTVNYGSTLNGVPSQAVYPPGLFVMWFCEIQKPVLYTGKQAGLFYYWFCTGGVVTNTTKAQFFANMNTPYGTTLTNMSAVPMTVTNAMVSAFPWDTLSISWNKATPTLEFQEIAVARTL